MATESPIIMPETSGKWATALVPPSTSNMAAEELKLLLKVHRFSGSGKNPTPSRSGSAPPSMEGSFLAIDNILSQQQDSSPGESMENLGIAIGNYESEEQLRADPAYFAYYCANVNLNPRLPPPLISWGGRRLVRHIGGYGSNWGLSSVDDSGNVSLHLSQGSSLPTHKEEPEEDQTPTRLQQQPASDWSQHDNTSSVDRLKVTGDPSQENFRGSPTVSYNESHVLNNGIAESVDHDSGTSSSYNSPISITIPNVLAADVPSSVPVVPISSSRDRTGSASSHHSGIINNTTARMKALSISGVPNQEQVHHKLHQQQQQSNLYHQPQSAKPQYINTEQSLHGPSKLSTEIQPVLQSSGFTPPLYATTAGGYVTTATNPFYSNMQAAGPGFFSAPYLGGYALNPNSIPPYVAGYPPFVVDGTAGPSINTQPPGISTAGSSVPPGAEIQNMNKFYGQLGFPIQQPSFVDPMYMQYPRQPFGEPYGVSGLFDPMTPRGGFMGGQISMPDPKKGLESSVYHDEHKIQQHQRNTSQANLNIRRGPISPNYFGNSQNPGVMMQYQTSPIVSPVLPGSPGANLGLPRGRTEMRYPPSPGGRPTGIYSGWSGRRGFENFEDPKIYNFLEELKSGKGRRFELSDITGHIVEFSSDQHGSRFIQQKLENCSAEEKASVFKEVLPHASRLMTDVFGNYVIQKFFEYGSPDQRKELAKQLTNQILTLSLQMYGCRVIQKALEVIELEQKAQLVRELDGHVMRCVRDQNGNHVIQKCIESIPTEKIGFVISAFRGHVATLSMHPYGCRVIQRVLEHCTDEVQCQFIVDEILESVCTLAQDQYGNYVTQHVLERGRAGERRQIISKLSGHIVQLSQHKFASNVIEKCLEHGGPAEQEIIINEIVGQNEGNDNLLTMMKDQFANYVVQKTLEICTDSQRVILLSRIRAHAHALKKYTYGKHIVARFEQVFGEENQSST